jgi:Fe2+ or Zn2+ uptake regulation protein
VNRSAALAQLTKSRHRITRTREALVDVMLDLDHHRPFSAADVFAAADGRLDLVTIYRNLETFAAAGVICRADRLGDTARFARADGEGTGGFAFVSGIRVWF